MLLPQALQRAVDQAYQVMVQHPDHDLPPFLRHTIYEILHSTDRGKRALALLSIACARFVLPIWKHVWPHEPLPDSALDLAERLVQGTVQREDIECEVAGIWQKLEDWGCNLDEKYFKAYDSGATAGEALFEVLGKNPFGDIDIDKQITNSQLDPYSQDTAILALSAYAGPLWSGKVDSLRILQFWEWWLKEAIPNAWQASEPD